MRTRGTVAGMAALVVLGVGCGVGSGDATEEVSTVTLDLLDGTEAAGTARIALAFDGEQGWMPGDAVHSLMEVEGVVDFAASEHDLAGVLEMVPVLPQGSVDDPAPSSRSTIALRRVDGASYDRWLPEGTSDGPWTLLEEDGDVTEVEVTEDGHPSTTVVTSDGGSGSVPADQDVGDRVVEEDVDDSVDDGSSLDALLSLDAGLDPSALLDEVQDMARSFTEQGREDVRGTATTRYRATVVREDIGVLALGRDVEPVIDVWVDDQGRLRRLEVGGARLELWDFGVEVDVQEPSPVAGPGDAGSDWGPFAPPTPAGEWAVQASGDAGGRRWEVWAAPHDLGGEPVTCRTLETTTGLPEGVEALIDRTVEGVPAHGGAAASCGYGSTSFSFPTTDPSLQVLVAPDWSRPDSLPLVALAVDERWHGGPVQIRRDGAPPVDLEVGEEGLVVWAPDSPAPPTEVRLAGGEVSCDVLTMDEQEQWFADRFPDEAEDVEATDASEGTEEHWFPPLIVVQGCVRA